MTPRGEGWYADPQDAPLPLWWSGLSVALQLAFLLSLVAAAFTLYVDLEILGFVDDLRFRPDTVTEADGARIDGLIAMSAVEVATSLLTLLLLIVWLYTAHHSARMDRTVLKHGSGWAIGGWFVPVLNLWRPFQMVTDVRRGATGEATVYVPRRQGWWWGTWMSAYALSLVAGFIYDAAASTPDDDPDAYLGLLATAASWERFSCVLSIVGAVLGIFLVREISALVLAPPPAA